MFQQIQLGRKASPSPSSAPAGSGKFGHGGGGSSSPFSFRRASLLSDSSRASKGGPSVHIRQLSLASLGSELCGGVIGKASNRMCVVRDCNVQLHAANKHDLRQLLEEEGDVCVFICARSGESNQVFTSPALGSDRFEDLSFYLKETRDVKQWEFLFRNLKDAVESDSKISSKELEHLEAKRLELEEKGKTPMKKKPRIYDFSPRSEAGFESTWVPMNAGDVDMGIGLETTLRDVVINLDTLKAIADGLKVSQQQFGTRTEEELNDLEFGQSMLRRVLGERPVEMGTMTVFEAIRKIQEENVGIDTSRFLTGQCDRSRVFMHTIMDQVWQANTPGLVRFKDQMVKDFNTTLTPMGQLFGMMSQQYPGDQFDHLRQEVKALSAKVNGGIGIGQGPGFTMGQQVGGNPGINTIGANFGTNGPIGVAGQFTDLNALVSDYLAVKGELTSLKTTLKTMEDRLSGGAVKVLGIPFRSWADTAAWLTTHLGGNQGAYTLFVDAHAFMALAFQEQATSTEHVAFKSSVAKAGYGSTQEALVNGSFIAELPAFFGWDKKHDALTGDARVLPGLKKYSDWDSGNQFSGLRFRMREKLEETVDRLTSQANADLGPSAASVASQMISESSIFLNALREWITREYEDLTNQGGDKEATWRLISHSVCTVFNDLHQARAFGQDCDDKNDRPGRVMWACLQGHRVMREYLRDNFSKHPKISFILNVHIRDNMVSRAQLDKLKTDISTCLTTANAANTKADRAVSLASAKNRSGGAGRGGGGGRGRGGRGRGSTQSAQEDSTAMVEDQE